ncbi:DNA mismatch repair endonuclease MutL [bacterium D16-51]|nr:DNA mismatch repair endonuclease MutL [bacterium D16-59]RKI60149.1 DNA mismatch repair endonuclease MutL [bacterium D16-51]
MAQIHLLNQDTINKIAAGEVIERPMAVVKELIENAIDAKATAVTVEIQDGGKGLIRITDNGSGIAPEDIELAFAPHATSKINDVTDLLEISSLGFRGEALSSIASVSQLEMVSKTKEELMGVRYCMDGGEKKAKENVGCPDGTTFLVRNLFYNTPARLKFLKTAQTEAGYVSGLVERMALSHPDISFRFINQKQTRLSTSGNGNLKDVIYHIYGREIAANLMETAQNEVFCKITGFIGKPVISRGNRNMMNYFINGRYIKSQVISRAIEEAYAPYSMQHRYPFTVLHIQVDSQYIDVNVHPQKMEIRFNNEKEIFQSIYHGISESLKHKEYIPEVTFQTKKEPEKKKITPIEPFEKKRREELKNIQENAKLPEKKQTPSKSSGSPKQDNLEILDALTKEGEESGYVAEHTEYPSSETAAKTEFTLKEPVKNEKQETLFEEDFLSEKVQKEVKIIGQVFSTYWVLQYEDTMYLIDQHAAHEKVLYERFMKEIQAKKPMTQLLQPPVILTLTMAQSQAVEENMEIFGKLGYQIEHFGGREYAVTGVPAHLPSIGTRELLTEVIDTLTEEAGRVRKPEILLDKIASMSCKAAVKGNQKLPAEQMQELLKELMALENPYHCPHGRPTMIRMTKKELEKRFKRIV